MKVRLDFVTNSSSSSFIIRAKEPLEEIKGYVEKLTKENFKGAFEEVADFYYSWMSDTADDEDLKKILDINDEQLFLMRVAKEDKLDDYLKLKKILEESNGDIYFISYEPYNDDYYDKYIEKNEVLMRGGL